MCENTDNFDNIEEEKIKVASNDEKEYSIYNYFKEHPSIFIAVISTLVAVISGAIRIISNIAITSELKSWGINTDYIEINTNQFDVIVVVLACLLISTMIQLAISDEVNIYRKKKELKWINELIFRELEVKLIDKKKEKGGIDSQFNERVEDQLFALSRQTIKNTNAHLKILIPILVIASVVTQFMLIYTLCRTTNPIFAIIDTLIIMCFGYLTSYLYCRCRKKKELQEKSLKELTNMQYKCIKECNNLLSKAAFGNLKKRNCNEEVWRKVSCLLVSFIFMIVFIFTFNRMTDSKNNFNIATIDNNQYAVIYSYDNKYYLEEAEIDGKRITINTTNQRILVSEDISIQNMTFEEVEKIKQEK